jgi:hypothetical protein
MSSSREALTKVRPNLLNLIMALIVLSSAMPPEYQVASLSAYYRTRSSLLRNTLTNMMLAYKTVDCFLPIGMPEENIGRWNQ